VKSTTYGKGLRGKATKLHSQVVRSRGRCENCGSTQNLQTAHIIPRRYAATRTDERNAYCMCARCHMRFTEWPNEWMCFISETIGLDEFHRLREKALTVTKVDWAAEVERLSALLKKVA
jgi:hypothetical protein